MINIESFFKKLKKTKKCWNWIGCKNEGGYGLYFYKNKNLLAHRLSYSLFKGNLVKGYEIDHICNNRGCVNPKHLRQISRQFNTLRGNGPFGLKDKSDLSVLSFIELNRE